MENQDVYYTQYDGKFPCIEAVMFLKKMKKVQNLYYLSGEEILIGDTVKLGDFSGKIVFVNPSNQYSNGYPKENWNYLKNGFGVETKKNGLIFQEEPDEDLVLIKQVTKKT